MEPKDLRQQIEDLALRLIVQDPACSGTPVVSNWLPALEQIRENAARQNAIAVAEAATDMIASLQGASGQPGGERIEAGLQQGILRLQQAMECAAGEQSQKNEESLAHDPELLSDFILESTEHLARIETEVLTLERDPCDSEALNSFFVASTR